MEKYGWEQIELLSLFPFSSERMRKNGARDKVRTILHNKYFSFDPT